MEQENYKKIKLQKLIKLLCQAIDGWHRKSAVPGYWAGDVKWITPAELDDNSYIITPIRLLRSLSKGRRLVAHEKNSRDFAL